MTYAVFYLKLLIFGKGYSCILWQYWSLWSKSQSQSLPSFGEEIYDPKASWSYLVVSKETKTHTKTNVCDTWSWGGAQIYNPTIPNLHRIHIYMKASMRYLEPGRRPATKARRSQHPGSAPASFYLLYDLQIFEILLSKFQKEPPLQFRMQCCIFCVAESLLLWCYSLHFWEASSEKRTNQGVFWSSELLEKTLLVSPKNVYTFFCIFSKSETLIKWVHSEKECVR